MFNKYQTGPYLFFKILNHLKNFNKIFKKVKYLLQKPKIKIYIIISLFTLVLLISQPRTRNVKFLSKQSIKNTKIEKNISFRSIAENEFKLIKNSIYKVYRSLNVPIEFCNNENFKYSEESTINIDQVLEHFGLNGLVEFYSNASLKYNMDIRNLNYTKPKKIDKLEFLELWNSTDINLLNTSLPKYASDLVDYERIEPGGHWKPKDCNSRFKIAIIIPFRDRLPHLKVITNYLHMFLQRQLLDYRIFVVEPTIPLNVSFNKGRVMNSAYLEALKVDKYDCIIFHDVDLLPEDDRNIYSCSSRPKHLSVAIDKFEYKLPYSTLVGGVLSIRSDQYKQINGYSNSYWGWGGEGNF